MNSRRYKFNDWWDFCTVITQEIARDNSVQTFINLADELNWRKIECVSEGGVFKIKNKAQELNDLFTKIHVDASSEEFTLLIKDILS